MSFKTPFTAEALFQYAQRDKNKGRVGVGSDNERGEFPKCVYDLENKLQGQEQTNIK